MIRNLTKTLIFSIIFCSCATNDNTTPITISKNNSKTVYFSDLFEKIEYIPLQTADSILLDGLYFLKINNNSYYFSTGFSNQRIIAFDKITGRCNLNLNAIGRGPEEYLFIHDFLLSKNDSTIEIIEGAKKEVILYSKSGKYLSTKKIDFSGTSSTIKDGANIWGYHTTGIDNSTDDTRYCLFLMDEQYKIKKSFLPISKTQTKYLAYRNNCFHKTKDGILFNRAIDNNIYLLEDKELKPVFKLDFKDNPITDKILKKRFRDVAEFDKYLNKKSYSFHSGEIFHTDDYMFMLANLGSKEPYFITFNKAKKQTFVTNLMINDFNGLNQEIKCDYSFYPRAADSNSIYFSLEPHTFVKWMKNKKENSTKEEWIGFLKQNSDLKNILKEIRKDDNPIIVKCTFKKE